MAKKGLDKKRYDKIAKFYDIFEFPMEVLAFSSWRKELMSKVEGSLVLEIGIGTGKNIPYYKDWEVVGADISVKMLEKAKKRVEDHNRVVHLIQADAEALPFKDEVFDAVISTYVFCSVENPVSGLKELYRVLKRGGRAYFLEHMRSENEVVGKILDTLNPIFRVFGPEINRRTSENIRAAGFKILEEKFLMTSIFRLVVAEKS